MDGIQMWRCCILKGGLWKKLFFFGNVLKTVIGVSLDKSSESEIMSFIYEHSSGVKWVKIFDTLIMKSRQK